MTPGFQALLRNEAWIDQSHRGRIRVYGEDRARLVHALSTNHIQQMKNGDEVYAFFLTALGKIVSDAYIACFDEFLLLDVEPGARTSLFQHIDHYIIADDATLEDVTDSTCAVIAASKRVYADLAAKPKLTLQSNLIEASPEDAELFRISQFQPQFGVDFGTATLPQETGLARALHFNKGCYLGQEIVERIRSRGHVNKILTGLVIDAQEKLPVGTKVNLAGEEIGQITSSAYQEHIGSRAIAMLRTTAAKPGTKVQVDGFSAEVHAVS